MGVTVDLKGRRVLLTGASSGIGAATCRAIVGCGGSVAMLARRKDRLDELEHELGTRSIGVRADVTDMESLEAAIDQAAQSLGGLDAVVTVAGRAMAGSRCCDSGEWRKANHRNRARPRRASAMSSAFSAVSRCS